MTQNINIHEDVIKAFFDIHRKNLTNIIGDYGKNMRYMYTAGNKRRFWLGSEVWNWKNSDNIIIFWQAKSLKYLLQDVLFWLFFWGGGWKWGGLNSLLGLQNRQNKRFTKIVWLRIPKALIPRVSDFFSFFHHSTVYGHPCIELLVSVFQQF